MHSILITHQCWQTGQSYNRNWHRILSRNFISPNW